MDHYITVDGLSWSMVIQFIFFLRWNKFICQIEISSKYLSELIFYGFLLFLFPLGHISKCQLQRMFYWVEWIDIKFIPSDHTASITGWGFICSESRTAICFMFLAKPQWMDQNNRWGCWGMTRWMLLVNIARIANAVPYHSLLVKGHQRSRYCLEVSAK